MYLDTGDGVTMKFFRTWLKVFVVISLVTAIGITIFLGAEHFVIRDYILQFTAWLSITLGETGFVTMGIGLLIAIISFFIVFIFDYL